MGSIENLKQQYNSKKVRIRERLSQFEKFFNEPCSWHYMNGELKLLPSEKNDDERIFEELSFCICTANASAEMGLKAVDSIRDVLIDGNLDEIRRRLKEVGYIYYNKRSEYILYTRNHLKNMFNFELKNKILSFNDKNELRKFFVTNIKGLWYKEASHFLRNIGFKGYAILDKHVINSLHEFGVLETNNKPKDRKSVV